MLRLFRSFREKKQRKLEKSYSRISFAQEGEDLLLQGLFEDKARPGFYVDVGAFHPFRFSNTYLFYKKGWRGINIDATPGTKSEFDKHRPRDINLHQPIANGRHALEFYMFNEPALNGFSRELSEERQKAGGNYHVIQTVQLQTAPLAEVLDQHLPANQTIDFLSIDAEGLDLDVLRSNNWDKYRPHVVMAEAADCPAFPDLMNSEAALFMKSQGYELVGKTPRTAFYQRKSD